MYDTNIKIGHKINECVKKINTCLRSSEDGHQVISCNKDPNCVHCKEKSQMEKKETVVNGKNNMLLEMIEIIAEKVDLIEQELEKQQEEIEN
ncbi:unnamed protein product [Brachionus calyciflorus]|uniref:Uncharacterized protein n=1 Tax=Brachionus calyciflorus TaxID=104777 RepID=A0A814Q0S5_9BILA|nr:unnamed protein product [Brachionus calyciflorus]